MVFSFASIALLVAISQWLFFPNSNMNFDPDVFIYVYVAFGLITWFIFKRKGKNTTSLAIKTFFITRVSILAIQALFWALGPYYNEANEVAYYQVLANVLVDPDYFSPYQLVKFGMPPGFQFWLMSYNGLFLSNSTGIYRDLVFSTFNMAFDFGVMFVMVKLAGLDRPLDGDADPGDETRKEAAKFGLLFYAASVFNVYYNNVRNFMDIISIFLAMLGMYYYTREKHGRAALMLSIATMIKFIPVFWLLIIVLRYLKRRDFKCAGKYLVVSATTAIAGFVASAAFYQQNPLYYFQEFLVQFYQWSVLSGKGIELNQAFWFSIYDSTFFLTGLATLFLVAILLVWKEPGSPSIHTFSAITSLYFIFQPWYDQRYFLWILPFLCLDLLSSKQRFGQIIAMFYLSVFTYLFFMHFPLDLGIDTKITSQTPLVGTVYRLTGQFISYAGFSLIVVDQVKQAIWKPKPSLGP